MWVELWSTVGVAAAVAAVAGSMAVTWIGKPAPESRAGGDCDGSRKPAEAASPKREQGAAGRVWRATALWRAARCALDAYRAEHARLLKLVADEEVARREAAAQRARAAGEVPTSAAAEAAREAQLARLWPWQRPFRDPRVRKVLREFRGMEVRYVAPATAVSILLAALNVCRPWVTGNLVDAITREGASMADAWPILWRLTLVQLAAWVANIIMAVLFAMARWNMTMSGRRVFFRALLRQDLAFHDVERSGELARLLGSEPDKLHNIVNHSAEKLLRALVHLVGGAAMALVVDWRYAVVGLLLRAPFIAHFARRSVTVVQRYSRVQAASLARAGAIAADVLGNIVAVQADCGERVEVRNYEREIATYLSVIRHTLVSETVLRYAQLVTAYAVQLGVTAFGVWRVVSGQLTIGEYTAFNSYLVSAVGGADELKGFLVSLSKLGVQCERYFAIRDREPAIQPGVGAVCRGLAVAEEAGGHAMMRFEHVTFQYPSRPGRAVLRGLSLDVPSGKVLALVGPSGAGKTTIMRLMERFYDPTSGRVLLGGDDLRGFDVRSVRRRIGFVPQEPTLFDRSVADNISYGVEPPPTREEVEAAARGANAHDFIERDLPNGYDTLVGERGARLSGGQKQRIAIARAMLRRPELLLLDEATSALDSESERLVQAALSELMRGRTTVVIAHRLSTVRHADQIAVIDGGRVRELGTHEELMAAGDGRYAGFIRAQLVDYEGPGGAAAPSATRA